SQWLGGGRDRLRWPSASKHLRPGLRDLLQERDIGLGVIGGRVDTSVPQDQADLLECHAMTQHLGRRRMPQRVRALERRNDAGPLHSTPYQRRDAVAPRQKDRYGAIVRRNT